MWTTIGSGRNAVAFNTSTEAHNMRQHRAAKKTQAFTRNLLTPHERTSAHQKHRCSCIWPEDLPNPFDQMQLAAS